MITPNDIIDRLEEEVNRVLPGQTVYKNLTPTNFERPSVEIECEGATVEVVNGGCARFRFQMLLRSFVTVDERHFSQFQALYQNMMLLLGIFVPAFLKVKDRALHLAGTPSGAVNLDYAEVKAHLTLTLSADEFRAAVQYPLMQEFYENIEIKEETL